MASNPTVPAGTSAKFVDVNIDAALSDDSDEDRIFDRVYIFQSVLVLYLHLI